MITPTGISIPFDAKEFHISDEERAHLQLLNQQQKTCQPQPEPTELGNFLGNIKSELELLELSFKRLNILRGLSPELASPESDRVPTSELTQSLSNFCARLQTLNAIMQELVI